MKTANARRIKLLITVSLSVLLLFGTGLEAAPNDNFLNRLAGTWEGDGKALGMPAHLQMKWEWVLGSKFLRLSLKNEMRNATGQVQVFEGHAYYHSPGDGKYEGKWFDSRGVSFSITGETDGDALIALWSNPQERGRSIYRFLEARKLEVVDSVQQKDGTWKEFGRFVVIRR